MQRTFVALALGLLLLTACDDPGITSVGGTSVANPTITYDSLNSPTTVTIATVTQNASIYYTLDGSAPNPNSFLYTLHYQTPIKLYQPATIKALATKAGLQDSAVVTKALNIVPVSLTVGSNHNFNGVTLTLASIHWYVYRDFYSVLHTTNNIVLQFSVHNGSGIALSTNPIYAWGVILEMPGNNQLNGLYDSGMYADNAPTFSGYSISNTANITDACLFDAASAAATSFVFQGSAPYADSYMNEMCHYFQVSFSRSDIGTVAIQ